MDEEKHKSMAARLAESNPEAVEKVSKEVAATTAANDLLVRLPTPPAPKPAVDLSERVMALEASVLEIAKLLANHPDVADPDTFLQTLAENCAGYVVARDDSKESTDKVDRVRDLIRGLLSPIEKGALNS